MTLSSSNISGWRRRLPPPAAALHQREIVLLYETVPPRGPVITPLPEQVPPEQVLEP
jgi:hypothetical protein